MGQITQFILTSLLKVCHQANPVTLPGWPAWAICTPLSIGADLAPLLSAPAVTPEAHETVRPGPIWLARTTATEGPARQPFPKATAATKALHLPVKGLLVRRDLKGKVRESEGALSPGLPFLHQEDLV